MKLFKGNVFVASLVSGIMIPVTNTFIYLLGMAVFMRDLVTTASATDPDIQVPIYSSDEALVTVMIGFAGIIIVNFILELIVTVICSPAVSTVLSKSKRFKKMFNK